MIDLSWSKLSETDFSSFIDCIIEINMPKLKSLNLTGTCVEQHMVK